MDSKDPKINIYLLFLQISQNLRLGDSNIYREKLLKITSLAPYLKAIEIGGGSSSAGPSKGLFARATASCSSLLEARSQVQERKVFLVGESVNAVVVGSNYAVTHTTPLSPLFYGCRSCCLSCLRSQLPAVSLRG